MVIAVRVALAILVMCATAAADPADELAWHAPATCPDVGELRARVEQRLGGPLDGLVTGIVVDVTREHGHFVAQVDLRGMTVANDVRTLTAPRCADLADAVAVIVARIASERRAAQPPLPPMAPTAPAPTPVVETRRIEVAAPPVAREWGSGIRLLGLSGIGGVPEIGLGGELAGHVRHRKLFAELALAAWAPSNTALHSGAPAGIDVDLHTIGLRGGWGPEDLPIRAWATIEYGMMKGLGIALANSQAGTGRWVAAGAGFGVAWPVAPLVRIVGSVEFVVPLQRAQFVLEDGFEVYRAWPVSSRAAFGVEVGWR